MQAAPPSRQHGARAPRQRSRRPGAGGAGERDSEDQQRGAGYIPFRSSRSHTVTMGRECLRWWMSHRDKVCTLCCELLNSDSFFSSAASEKADIPPKPSPRRPTRWGQGEESFAALVAASPPHPTLPQRPHHGRGHIQAPAANQQDGVRPAVTSWPTHAPPLPQLALGKEVGRGGRDLRAEGAGPK